MASERKSSTPWRTPQPIDPRIVSPMSSETPMTARKIAKTTSMKAAATGGGDATDLAGDRRRLGLGQVDMGDDEGHRRIADGADLGAQAGRRLARLAGLARRRPGTGRWWWAGRRRRRVGPARRRCRVRGRVVQGRAPLMRPGGALGR